jgi:transposase-like protein
MKTVGTWSIDTEVKSWIDQKIANKSQFVNRILKDAMIEEIVRQQRREQRPKCTLCKSTMRLDHNDELICVNIHCGGV